LIKGNDVVEQFIRFFPLTLSLVILPFAAVIFAQEPTPIAGAKILISEAAPRPVLPKIPEITLTDAVMKTLQANPGIFVSQEKVVQSEGLRQKAAGQFDWTVRSQASRDHYKVPLDSYDAQAAQAYSLLNNIPYDDYLQEDTNTYSLGLIKQFRSGVTVAPNVAVVDYKTNADFKVPVSRSEMRIEFNVPLMRGLGSQATGAEELAAISQTKASRLAARQNIAQIIYSTSINYWNSLAAKMSFELIADTQERSKKLLELVDKLVRAGSLEPAALNQAKANSLSGQVDVSAGETDFYRSRQALALAMGMTPKELPYAPNPGSQFPSVIDAAIFNQVDISRFIEEALTKRGDYLAAQTDIETAQTLFIKAQNDTKPKLDLGLKLGYAGEDEVSTASRYSNSLGRNVTGLNSFVSLSLELPVANNAARGNMIYRKSQVREAQFIQNDIANRIASDILVAYRALSSAINEHQLASESEKSYKKAVEFENQKYKAGSSTLTALIDIEDRYFRARLASIEALRKYSVAMAQFRLVTGTMLDVHDKILNFDERKLLEFPPINQAGINNGMVKK
jgi:outer membrane protein TolC